MRRLSRIEREEKRREAEADARAYGHSDWRKCRCGHAVDRHEIIDIGDFGTCDVPGCGCQRFEDGVQ